MSRLRPTRNQLIEIVVLSALTMATVLGLQSRVLTDTDMTSFAAAYSTYLVWRALANRRERSKQQHHRSSAESNS